MQILLYLVTWFNIIDAQKKKKTIVKIVKINIRMYKYKIITGLERIELRRYITRALSPTYKRITHGKFYVMTSSHFFPNNIVENLPIVEFKSKNIRVHTYCVPSQVNLYLFEWIASRTQLVNTNFSAAVNFQKWFLK